MPAPNQDKEKIDEQKPAGNGKITGALDRRSRKRAKKTVAGDPSGNWTCA
jgi:hypothetical protein